MVTPLNLLKKYWKVSDQEIKKYSQKPDSLDQVGHSCTHLGAVTRIQVTDSL